MRLASGPLATKSSQLLTQTLRALRIGAPVASAYLTMVPLLTGRPTAADYLLLDDALDAGLVEVTEASEAGSVPELVFRNRSDRDVLLVDGEELVGAKQNGVLNLTILVAAGQRTTIPVSCVEAGRWAWRTQRFVSGRRKLHAAAGIAKMRGVSASLRETGSRARDDIQSEVWRAVDAKMRAFACRSETAALHDVYASTEERLQPIRSALSAQPGQVGAVFFIDGKPAGLELFDAATTPAKLLPKLVDGDAFDALESAAEATQGAPSLTDVRALLARIAAAPRTCHPGVAIGTDVRIEDGALHAAALCARQRFVDPSALCAEGQAQ